MNSLVKKRFGDEILDVREFVRPNTYMVKQIAPQFDSIEDMWLWITKNIRFTSNTSKDEILTQELYYNKGIPLLRYRSDDIWNYPSETLRDMVGDCDDRAILLVSMARHNWPNFPIYVTIGHYNDYGHAWVSIPYSWGWRVIDPILPHDQALAYKTVFVPEAYPYLYNPDYRFNEIDFLTAK